MKTYTEDEVRKLLKEQIKRCSRYVYDQTYCLRSPTPNGWDKMSTLKNLDSIVEKTPIIKF